MTATLTKIKNAIPCSFHSRKIKAKARLFALGKIFSKLNFPMIIGGNSARRNCSRFSFWMAEPKEIFEFHAGQEKPFEKLKVILKKYKLSDYRNQDLPEDIFVGGWAGFFSYELVRYIEKVPENAVDDLKIPVIRLCFYDKVLAYDHLEDIFWLIVLQIPGDTKSPEQKIGSLQNFLVQSERLNESEYDSSDLEDIDFGKINRNMTKDYYLQCLEKIKKHIFDGDVYQVNFSQRFMCDFNTEPVELFNWQNHFNPCGYAAYLDAGNFQIVSASPEMFLTIHNGTISTKPIKGTRPRVGNVKNADLINRKNFDVLVKSEKEQAELNMIVDLERNDLARICEPGTRKVTQKRTIEEYPTVFHAVATVSGLLRNGVDFCDCIKAAFPGGSITGAPKIASMKIIDKLEPTQRSVYTGSIGFLGLNGNVSLNIAIRTIIIKDKKAFVQTGGGIVADSNLDAEWEETLIKARALIAGIESVNKIIAKG